MNYTKGITHSGIFHADEVMATALLYCAFPNITITRVADVSEIPYPLPEDTIVYDIGGGEFDHHGIEKKYWDDDITPASSAGLIWWKFKKQILAELAYFPDRSPEYMDLLDSKVGALIKSIDAVDNGLYTNDKPLFDWSSFVFLFNPNWDENMGEEDGFRKAVFFSRLLLDAIVWGCCRDANDFDAKKLAKAARNMAKGKGLKPLILAGRRSYQVPLGPLGGFWQDYGVSILKSFGIDPAIAVKAWYIVDSRIFQSADNQALQPESTPQYNLKDILRWFMNDDLLFIGSAIIERVSRKAAATLRAVPVVEQAIEASKDGVMVLEEYVPWQSTLKRSENPKAEGIYAVAYPSARTGFHAQVVRDRAQFPAEWPALSQETLAKQGISFCHPGLFLIGADTMENAVAACKHCQKL